ncbi:hypothetical protein B0H63DRAFT_285963 [Podospora didyma]|uniref:Uncharacterized protein n=1 Tax=Podospora didyma TaxID=330526 RepID=A0AAE0K8B9_9PEZI|nr:hypothetical protein B0H63DRAFT_285963 [Podospora didyma]
MHRDRRVCQGVATWFPCFYPSFPPLFSSHRQVSLSSMIGRCRVVAEHPAPKRGIKRKLAQHAQQARQADEREPSQPRTRPASHESERACGFSSGVVDPLITKGKSARNIVLIGRAWSDYCPRQATFAFGFQTRNMGKQGKKECNDEIKKLLCPFPPPSSESHSAAGPPSRDSVVEEARGGGISGPEHREKRFAISQTRGLDRQLHLMTPSRRAAPLILYLRICPIV